MTQVKSKFSVPIFNILLGLSLIAPTATQAANPVAVPGGAAVAGVVVPVVQTAPQNLLNNGSVFIPQTSLVQKTVTSALDSADVPTASPTPSTALGSKSTLQKAEKLGSSPGESVRPFRPAPGTRSRAKGAGGAVRTSGPAAGTRSRAKGDSAGPESSPGQAQAEDLQRALAPIDAALEKASAGNLSPTESKAAADEDWAKRIGEGSRLNVWMTSSEAVPFAKTGGLADVVDGLSRELAAKGHRVTMVLPNYKGLKLEGVPKPELVGSYRVSLAGREEEATLWRTRSGPMEVLLVGSEKYFGEEGIYGNYQGEHANNDERFLFFSKAALEAARYLGQAPDIIHAHDWPTGLVPALLKLVYAADPFFAATRSVFSIHNMAYQGIYPKESALKGFKESDFTPDKLEYFGNISYLKAGIAFADRVTTVSTTYAEEARRSAEIGRGMEGLLRQRGADFTGIVNGLDPGVWDPRTDRQLDRNFGEDSWRAGKAANKAALQSFLGLPVRPDAPVFGIAARLDPQKGLDLVAAVAPLLARIGAQLILVGNGDAGLTAQFEALAKEFPDTVRAWTKFDEGFARKIYAASDFYLMPSRFEPCGLSQLISMRYGSIPLVTPTGGLKDTVTDGKDGIVIREATLTALEEAILKALALYRAPPEHEAMVLRAMAHDSAWTRPAEEYLDLYRAVLAKLKSV